jgi:DNA-binding NtrC family response regulator
VAHFLVANDMASHFLTELGNERRAPHTFSPSSMDALRKYDWPGNVRQLKNAVQSAVLTALLNKHSLLEVVDLPADILQPKLESAVPPPRPSNVAEGANPSIRDLDEELAKTELSLIQRAIEQSGGRKNEAWKLLGLNDRFALHRRVKTLIDEYPALVAEFPVIQKLYAKQ